MKIRKFSKATDSPNRGQEQSISASAKCTPFWRDETGRRNREHLIASRRKGSGDLHGGAYYHVGRLGVPGFI
ncbi:uncharacterized protein PHALS_03233 [Plasmopara halstedii]|uniref:Uncharacterized protein n=1 Tax=Plasmopara halstedii TaxID=4781 RepID=A0A0P1A8X4_PLAHL|nr:uncharacterized protein PHALS_03233 [Plasmopara halstedii]CEG36624.1 hypothetical protein PHALS_03233 [Plasmopara halstedii]|eukprot:XP_024572993.1 hypothetical protein PHALS_03233 [Plasmopara halstedii]